MVRHTYATREQFMEATDVHTTARLSATIDRLLQDASDQIDQEFGRHFHPKTATVTYNSPRYVSPAHDQGTGFWVDRDLRSVSSATEDGTTATGTIEVWPAEFGPPYSWVGLTGSEIAITGEWGYSADTTPAGALDAAISDTTGTSITITDSSKIGVGDLIIIDSERLIVTEKALADTTADLNDTLTADVSDVTVTLDDATLVKAGEIITLDSERMKIISISSNDLTVIRAYDGSTLAAHSTGINVWAARTCTATRGAYGSTAATHSDTTAITRNLPPAPIRSLCLAEALVTFQQEHAAYARTAGSGDNERETRAPGLADMRKRARVYKRRRLAGV